MLPETYFIYFLVDVQQYQQQASELEAALKQKTKEIKRMKASFHSMKDLNDSMRRQVRDLPSSHSNTNY